MLRQQVLKLYRSFLRTIRDVPDEEGKKELLEWARSDFKTNKHHTDEVSAQLSYVVKVTTHSVYLYYIKVCLIFDHFVFHIYLT
jgi:hypothetical protein